MEDMCNFTGKISANFRKFCLELFFVCVHTGFNFIIRAHDVVNQGSQFLLLKLGLVEFYKGVVGFL